MKSFLVDFSFTTRVVVPDDFTQDQILSAAKENIKTRLDADRDGELLEAASLPQPDNEVPYNQEHDSPGSFGVYP
jgi:hypothetical protein